MSRDGVHVLLLASPTTTALEPSSDLAPSADLAQQCAQDTVLGQCRAREPSRGAISLRVQRQSAGCVPGAAVASETSGLEARLMQGEQRWHHGSNGQRNTLGSVRKPAPAQAQQAALRRDRLRLGGRLPSRVPHVPGRQTNYFVFCHIMRHHSLSDHGRTCLQGLAAEEEPCLCTGLCAVEDALCQTPVMA